jgi:hypothetical protein
MTKLFITRLRNSEMWIVGAQDSEEAMFLFKKQFESQARGCRASEMPDPIRELFDRMVMRTREASITTKEMTERIPYDRLFFQVVTSADLVMRSVEAYVIDPDSCNAPTVH